MLRETFKDNDTIRVHPIITKGGAAVNQVPDSVHVETYIRAKTLDAVLQTNNKIDKAIKHCKTAINIKPNFFEAQKRKKWNKRANRHQVIHLNQATVMIVGAGGIGQEVGRLCKAFNMKVIGIDPKFDQLENFDEVIKPEQLYDFLGNIDVLVSTVMHTPETQNLFNLKLFKKMKPTSIFINIGRGKTTSLDDLVNALENNIISGAGLDVFEEEPLPKNHKLWNLPGVIITPHVALLDTDGIITNRRYEIIQKNIILFNEGKELHNIVDKEKWY